MTLAPGTRLCPYEILSPLGAGGMGEVYKARDSKLKRDVAIKVLPASLAADSDALARFEREAKAISQLSHPHIYALCDVGSQKASSTSSWNCSRARAWPTGWTRARSPRRK